MADFYIDDILNKATDLLSAAGRKTEELVGVSKLRFQALQISSQLSKAFERLGMIVYEQKVSGLADNDIIEACIKEITVLKSSLEELNDKVYASKNSVKCTNCNASVAKESSFCPKCGAIIVQVAHEEEHDHVYVDVSNNDE